MKNQIAYIYKNGEIFVNIKSVYEMMDEALQILESSSTLETNFEESKVCVMAMKEVIQREMDKIEVEKFTQGL